jgi:hypothetical protein
VSGEADKRMQNLTQNSHNMVITNDVVNGHMKENISMKQEASNKSKYMNNNMNEQSHHFAPDTPYTQDIHNVPYEAVEEGYEECTEIVNGKLPGLYADIVEKVSYMVILQVNVCITIFIFHYL